jgi:hypothetical protein
LKHKARYLGVKFRKHHFQVRFLFTSFIASDATTTKEFHAFVMKLSHLLHIRVWDHNLNSTVALTISNGHQSLCHKGHANELLAWRTRPKADPKAGLTSKGTNRLYANVNKQISMLQRWSNRFDKDSFVIHYQILKNHLGNEIS